MFQRTVPAGPGTWPEEKIRTCLPSRLEKQPNPSEGSPELPKTLSRNTRQPLDTLIELTGRTASAGEGKGGLAQGEVDRSSPTAPQPLLVSDV